METSTNSLYNILKIIQNPILINENETATLYQQRNLDGSPSIGNYIAEFKEPQNVVSNDVAISSGAVHKCIAWVNFDGTK